jgi:Calcineurin-like phosphoesterase
LRTLIVSDLHLGSAGGADVLRRPELRALLLAELDGIDRVVLLGDVLELRHGPRREALAAARPFFEELGRVIGASPAREVVVAAGNHDHALIEPWLARRSELPAPAPLGPEQRLEAGECSSMAAQLAQWAAPARLTVAYPGLWVRPDVYATHGHYLDCHLTIPTLERLGIGAMGRMLHRSADGFTGPEDYEAVMTPVFAWIDAVARQAPTGETLNGGTTVRAWRALGGGESTAATHADGARNGYPDGYRRRAGRLGRELRTRTLAGAFGLGVAALNRAGMGPFHADLSSGELRRAGLRAMGEVAERMGLYPARHAGPAYVVFGHTHRAGPLQRDDAAEWRAPCGVHLMNSGCWTYDSHFLTGTPGESPYWPGSCVLVEEQGPPVLRRLLATHSHAELAPSRATPSPA